MHRADRGEGGQEAHGDSQLGCLCVSTLELPKYSTAYFGVLPHSWALLNTLRSDVATAESSKGRGGYFGPFFPRHSSSLIAATYAQAGCYR